MAVALCVALALVGCPSKAPAPLPDNQAPAANVEAAEPVFSKGVQEVDEEAPRFSVQDLEGATISRDDYTNKVLVLYFWSGSCGASLAKLKAYAPMLQRYQETGVELLAVCMDQGPEQAAEWAKKNNVTVHIAMSNAEIESGYFPGANDRITVPEVRIIDRDGNLRYRLDATTTDADLKLALTKLVGETVGGDASVDNAAATDDAPAPAAVPRGG